jgi:hypothetical protein
MRDEEEPLGQLRFMALFHSADYQRLGRVILSPACIDFNSSSSVSPDILGRDHRWHLEVWVRC